jgi:hypothetical protein
MGPLRRRDAREVLGFLVEVMMWSAGYFLLLSEATCSLVVFTNALKRPSPVLLWGNRVMVIFEVPREASPPGDEIPFLPLHFLAATLLW